MTTQAPTTQPVVEQTTQAPDTPQPAATTFKEAENNNNGRGRSYVPIIVGAVLGTFAALALATSAVLYYRWRQHPERPLFPWQHNERPVLNNNPAYNAPAVNENPMHV